MLGGVDHVHAGAEERDRAPAGPQRGVVRVGVDPLRQPANDRQPRRCQLPRQAGRHLAPVGRGAARPDDTERQIVRRGQRALDIEDRGGRRRSGAGVRGRPNRRASAGSRRPPRRGRAPLDVPGPLRGGHIRAQHLAEPGALQLARRCGPGAGEIAEMVEQALDPRRPDPFGQVEAEPGMRGSPTRTSRRVTDAA
jgi:hypothetical protein